MIDMSMEALVLAGLPKPPCVLVPTGVGEDGKSLRSSLRANTFAALHAYISPKVFQVPEELRKQGNQFAFATVLTAQ